MDEIKTKQQVVEKIKGSEKILVTVSNNPSVDELSAALALTLLLDKQSKYATAIFSGETPPAIAFLEPEKTFDDTTDSLRDFIIALNKEKADHLRYKVEGDAVKIFITPYKTVIDQTDLEFSQGDYNVELVIAIGVSEQEDLDGALANHGQIMHDASIITITAGDQTSNLGGIDWHDGGASSESEMIAGLAEALKIDKKKTLLDEQIATALLTGIVAQTDRFSNEHTTSKSMTVAAALMAAGADQQLIANELQAGEDVAAADVEDDTNTEESTDGDSSSLDIDNSDSGKDKTEEVGEAPADPSLLSIAHDGESLADLDRRVRGEEEARNKVAEEVEALQNEAARDEAIEDSANDAYSAIEAKEEQRQAERQAEIEAAREAARGEISDPSEPILGGTLNATSEQAAEDSRREAEADQNKTILSHSVIGHDEPSVGNNPEPIMSQFDSPESLGEGIPGVSSELAPEVPRDEASAYSEQRVIEPLPPEELEALRPEVSEAPVEEPAPEPVLGSAAPMDFGLPMPPPIPDFSQMNGAPALPLPPTQQPELLGDILAPEPQAQPQFHAEPYAQPEVQSQLDTQPTQVYGAYAGSSDMAPPLPPMGGVTQPGFVAQPGFEPQSPVINDMSNVQPVVPTSAYGMPEPQPVAPVAPVAPPDPGQFQIPTA